MKHLHYSNLVIAISNELATAIEEAATAFMNAGRNVVFPVSGYRDEREEISVQVAFGPGIGYAITDPYLSDDREPASHDQDSIEYINAEREALENHHNAETPDNVVVYGRFERRTREHGTWTFTGLDGIDAAHNVIQAVQLMNENGYAVVTMTETGSPGEDLAWSNVYIVGRWI